MNTPNAPGPNQGMPRPGQHGYGQPGFPGQVYPGQGYAGQQFPQGQQVQGQFPPGQFPPGTQPGQFPGQPYGMPPGPPPKKSKKGLIVAMVVVGLLLLGGIGTGAGFYLDAHADGGDPPTGAPQPELCGKLVSEQTRAALHVTNVNPRLNLERTSSDGVTTECAWNQTEGVDGEGHRDLQIRVETDVPADGPPCRGIPMAPPEVGEPSCLGHQQSGNITDIELKFQTDGKLITVERGGWDVGLFSHTPADPQEFVNDAVTVGKEVVANLGG